jgi:lipopolysaccharide/colanic/teichoic acid biosynthesis glycosyltransferase
MERDTNFGMVESQKIMTDKKINLLYIGTNGEVIDQLREHNRISLISRKEISTDEFSFLSGNNPDVIICERFLPGSDGFTIYEAVREHPALNAIPFILVAPDHEPELLTAAMRHGIDDVYILPLLSNEALLGRIDFLREYKLSGRVDESGAGKQAAFRLPISKRLFDIVVASSALVMLSPILILVMIAIRLESKGKVYYTSTRVGRKPFSFYKFRSMRVGADKELKKLAKQKNQYMSHSPAEEVDMKKPCPCQQKENFTYCSPVLHTEEYSICDTWYIKQKTKSEKGKPGFIKIPDDPRVTKVGKIIRNTSIDELPQLINVIKGDMSIVGNRPLPIYEAEKLTSDVMSKRFIAPAGLTGLWQVEKRGRKGAMSDEERKSLDNRYAELFIEDKYSFFYDIKLIMRTLPVIIQKDSV